MIYQKHTLSRLRTVRLGLIGTFTALALTLGGPAAAVVTVGADGACDFNNLQAAVDAIPNGGTELIRLANNLIAEPVQIVGVSVDIFGGYTSCSDSTSNANDRSVIRGFGGVLPVVFASGFANAQPTNLSLTSVIVEQGSSEYGAGIRIGARYAARLSNVIVRDNVSLDSGGGIYIDGSNGASLQLEFDTRVEDNLAGRYGGGLYCKNGLVDFRDGAIDENEAGAHGGGVFLDNCELTGAFSGHRSVSHNAVDFRDSGLDDDDLLNGNDPAGGGVFATNNAVMKLGSTVSTTVIERNEAIRGFIDNAGFDNFITYGTGGGIHAVNSDIELTNVHVARNRAYRGGGVSLQDGAVLLAQRDPDGCQSAADLPGCASIYANIGEGHATGFTGCVSSGRTTPGRAGGLLLRSSSRATLDGIIVKDNTVSKHTACVFNNELVFQEGAAAFLTGGTHLELLNTLVEGNRGTDEGDAKDIIHLAGNGPRLTVAHSTIVSNDKDVIGVIRSRDATSPRVETLSSIIVNGGGKGFATANSSDVEITADCLYANDPDDFADQPGIATRLAAGNNPDFINPSARDFRLSAGSEAVDFCDADRISTAGLSGPLLVDHDGNDRPVLVTNPGNAYDLGAFEYQSGIAAEVADLGITIDDGGFNYAPNSTMGYTITLDNQGPARVSGVTFYLGLDAGVGNYSVIPFSSDWACSENGQTITCSYDADLSAGATAPDVAVQFQAPGFPTQLSSTVQILASPTIVDPVDSNNQDTATTSIGQDADLKVSVIDHWTTITPGTRPDYGYELENLGPDAASQPHITFTFPGVALEPRVDEIPTGFSCGTVTDLPNGTRTLACERTSMALTAYEFRISARLPDDYDGEEWTIGVSALSGSDDPDPSNNELETVGTIGVLTADLEIKGTSPEALYSDRLNRLDLTVENLGPGLAVSPVLTGLFTEGAANPLFVTAAGFACLPLGTAPYAGFECLANADIDVFDLQTVRIDMTPVNAGPNLTLEVNVISATDDPDIGPGSNNVVSMTVPVISQPGEDTLFSDTFE